MATVLPRSPSFDHLKREAKALLKSHKAGDFSTCQILKNLTKLEASSDAEILESRVTLLEVQQALSIEYGFSSWAELKSHIESKVARIDSVTPVMGIGSYDEAVAHYVDWLGFSLDWEWREAPGQPVIMAISRDSVSFMLNEHPDSPRSAVIHMKVSNLDVLAEEWNAKRPGSVSVRSASPPYEFPDLPIADPFGNTLTFEGENSQAEKKVRASNAAKMRKFVRRELDEGLPFPTPEDVRNAIGPDLGTAIEVLNEFPGYGEAFHRRKQERMEALAVEIVDLAPVSVLVLEGDAPLDELPATTIALLPRVHQFLSAQGHPPSNTPLMRIIDVHPAGLRIECGYPVEPGTKQGGDFVLRELPGGMAITALHTGSPDLAASSWEVVIGYAHDHSFKLNPNWGGIGGWQVYLNTPDPKEPQSRLTLPVADPRNTE